MDLKNLEEKAVEIEIDKNLIKVVSVEGSVKSVSGFNKPIKISPITPSTSFGKSIRSYLTGHQKRLQIALYPETSTPEKIGLLKFKGTSPVRKGDLIKAGLILGEDVEKYGTGDALYIDIFEKDGSLVRRDFMDGYNPTHGDAKKLGLLI